jgi:hypothetical protein
MDLNREFIEALPNWSQQRRARSRRVLPVGLLAAIVSVLFAAPAAASPAWLPPTELSAGGHDASEPVISMDEAGETVAVWQRQSESEIGEVVQGSTRSPGHSFSAPFELAAASSEQALAMTPSGEAVAVWRHFDLADEGDYKIQAAYRPPGGSFSTPFDVAATPNAAIPQNIHVAVDAAGDTVVVWAQQEPGAISVVKASVRPAGGSFTAPSTISPTPVVSGHSARDPRIAIDAAGEAVAVWTYENGKNDVVQAARGSLSGGFSAPAELSSPGQEAATPAIAISPGGEATAAWSRSNGTDYVIETATASGGSFSSPVELSDPAQNALEPEVAIGPSGAPTIVWTRSNGANFIVEAISGSGGSFGSPVAVSEPGENAERPQLAESRSGSVAIVWQRSNGSEEVVQGVVGSPGTFGAPANLSAAGQESRFPLVAMDGNGDATAVWRSDGSSKVIDAAGYDADAPVLHGVSIPPSGIVGVPVTFSASPFDVWPIASTSFGFGDGSTTQGTSVSHVYEAPGVYSVTVTAQDGAGTAVSAQGTISIRPSNEFRIGRLSLNRRRGTAVLALYVPGPGKIALSGRDVRKTVRRPIRAGTVKIPIAARGKARRKLQRLGAVHLRLAIAYTPIGGDTRVIRKRVTLIEKIH